MTNWSTRFREYEERVWAWAMWAGDKVLLLMLLAIISLVGLACGTVVGWVLSGLFNLIVGEVGR